MGTDVKFEVKCGGLGAVVLHNPVGAKLTLPRNGAVTLHDQIDGFYAIAVSGTAWLADRMFSVALSTPTMDEPLVAEREANAQGLITGYVEFELADGIVL